MLAFSALNNCCSPSPSSYLELGWFVIVFGCWLSQLMVLEGRVQLYTWHCPLHSVAVSYRQRKSIWIHTLYNMKKSLKSSKRLWYLTLVLTQICLFRCLYGESKNSCLDIRLNLMFLGVFKLNAILKPPVHIDFVSSFITIYMPLHSFEWLERGLPNWR